MTYPQQLLHLLVLDVPLFLSSYYVLMLVLWLFVVEISRIVVRYGKILIPLYLNLHSITMTFISLLTILYTSIYFSLVGIQFTSQIQKIRIIFMFVMLALILIQMGMGIVSRISIFSIKYSRSKQTTKKVHKYFGYFTILFSRVVISLMFIQEQIKNPEQKSVESQRMKAWFFVFGSVYFIIILLEFIYKSLIPIFIKRRIQKAKDTIPQQLPQQSIYQQLAKDIARGVSSESILSQFPLLRYVIYNNRIYDIEDFVHPGGQSIIRQIIGQEINYYMYGGHATYLNPIKHQHSIFVEQYFHRKPSILIKFDPIIIKKDLLQNDINIWKTKIFEVFGQSSTALFHFESENYHIKNYYENLKQFGKYFILQAYTESYRTIKRPYSIILSYTQQSIQYRKTIKEIFQNRANLGFIQNIKVNQYSQTLPMIIKYYQGGKLTSRIKNIPQTQYKISGPYGAGLKLYPQYSGHIVIITGGTGILPFLDLLDYIYRNLILNLLSKSFGEAQVQRLNPLNINYNIVSSLTVKLYASFRNQYQFYGQSLLIDLYTLCKSIGQEIFDMELRFSQGNYYGHGMKVKIDHIQQSTMKNIINSNPNRLYVCGPPQMNKQIVNLFLQEGGDENLLHVL